MISFMLDEEDITKYTKFEMLDQLRETGGKVTFTGQYDITTENERYKNSHGMNSVYISYASVASKESVATYTSHKDKIANGISDGILRYLNN